MPNSTITFLNKQIEAAKAAMDAIDAEIALNPPDTTDQLLMLREAQNGYRCVIDNLRAAIDACE